MDEPEPRARQPLVEVLERLLKIGFGLGGLTSLATGVWMLTSPQNWYEVFPGSVSDFGPLNLHLIRDLGAWYIAGGVLLLFALSNPRRFGGVVLVVMLIAVGLHAAAHAVDIATGVVGGEHWVIDGPLVFLPILLLGLMLWIWWRVQSERIPEYHRSPGEDGRAESDV